MPAQQARYFLLTIPHHLFTPYLPNGISYIKGQLEMGANTGYKHWQVLVAYPKKVTVARVKQDFGDSIHVEITKSSAANDYVWKEETSIQNTRFELGKLAIKRNCPEDWDAIWDAAKKGKMEDIPANIRVTSYNALQRIAKGNLNHTHV